MGLVIVPCRLVVEYLHLTRKELYMDRVVLQQLAGDHLFSVIYNGAVIDRCDLITAEEIAVGIENEGNRVTWLYPEDQRKERNARHQ